MPSGLSYSFLATNYDYSRGGKYTYLKRGIYQKKVYNKCAAGLVGVLKKANSFHMCFAAKQYQDLPTSSHAVPSSDLK